MHSLKMYLSVDEILLFNCSNAFVTDCQPVVKNNSMQMWSRCLNIAIESVFMLNTATAFNLSQ